MDPVQVHTGEVRVNLVVVSLTVGGHIDTLSGNCSARQTPQARLVLPSSRSERWLRDDSEPARPKQPSAFHKPIGKR